MSCGIYKIINLVNNKIYIGQSIDIERRWNDEKKLISVNSHLKNSFNTYGLENFKFEIFHICDKEMLNDYEEYFELEDVKVAEED
jgi:group I intron endonuclease